MTAQRPPVSPTLLPHLDATSEQALKLVHSLAAQDPSGGAVALVEAWVQHGNVAAVAAVADANSGAARKAARRGLNVLRSRGAVPPPRTHVTRLAPPDPSPVEDEAYLLAPDSSGSELIAIARRGQSGRTTATFVIFNDAYGVLRVDNDELSRSRFVARIEQAHSELGYRAVRVPAPWARWRVARALETHARRGVPEPLGVTTARPLLQPVPSEMPEHPLDAEGLLLGPEDAAERARASAKLHELPELRGWLPPKQAVDAMLLEVGRTLTPDAEPPPGHVERELEKQIQAAADRYFSPQVREQIVSLMRDATLSVLARAGEQVALDMVATTEAVQRAGLITDPPHEIPFLRAFFDKAVAVLVAQNQGQLRIPIPPRHPVATAATESPAGDEAPSPSSADAATPAANDEVTRGPDDSEPNAGATSSGPTD